MARCDIIFEDAQHREVDDPCFRLIAPEYGDGDDAVVGEVTVRHENDALHIHVTRQDEAWVGPVNVTVA